MGVDGPSRGEVAGIVSRGWGHSACWLHHPVVPMQGIVIGAREVLVGGQQAVQNRVRLARHICKQRLIAGPYVTLWKAHIP